MALFVERLGVDCPKQSVGTRQVGKISKDCRGICDRRACQRLRSVLRFSQKQPRQSGESEGGKTGPEREQCHQDREMKERFPHEERKRKESVSKSQQQ